MEFVDGETLRSKIYEGKNDLNKLLQYLVQVAEGLAKAHSAGIVHRDLKPDNIMITRDGFAKILDFGLAKLSAPELFSSSQNDDSSQISTLFLQQSVPGTILGTVGYMSPEQACGDSTKIDLRTDIFAFGCILFEAATKRVAFQGASDIDTIHKIIYAETPVISDYNSTAAADLQRILRRCLAKDPDARYQTAKDVAIELGELTSGSHDKVGSAPGEVRSSLEQLSQTTATKVFKVNNTSRATLLLTVGVLLLVVLATAAYFVVTRKRTLISPQQRLISTFPGSHRSATFSPDAKSIAYVSDVDNVPQVWTRNLAEEAAKQITFGESGSSRPRWSPNGDQIIYGRTVEDASGIWSVKPEGGEPRKLIEGGRNGNWSWDGKRIVFERGYDIWTTNSDGSDQRRIEGVPPTDLLLADRTPAFSPDGKLIVFFQKDKGPIGDLWVIPSAGGQARRITFDNTHGGHPVFTHDGKYIVFSSQRAGSLTLWKVPVNGGEPEAVLVSAGEDSEPAISRDGSQLIYTNTRNQFQLVSTEQGSGETKTLHESRVDLYDPSFSPSGDKILFFQMASSGDIQLFTINADGTGLAQVTHGKDQRNIHPQWSADGASVYFYQFAPTVSFRKLQLGNEQSTELVAGWEWGTHIGARVDPEGRRVIYSKLDKGRVVATMIRDLTKGTESAFTIPLLFPRWSPDGQNIVGSDPTAELNLADLIICPVNGGECRRFVRGKHPRWNTPSHLYFVRTSKQRDVQEIWTLPITGGKETKVIDFGPLHPIGSFFDVSSSGKIVWVKYQRGRNELWLASLSAS